jgi:hypothetical protein
VHYSQMYNCEPAMFPNVNMLYFLFAIYSALSVAKKLKVVFKLLNLKIKCSPLYDYICRSALLLLSLMLNKQGTCNRSNSFIKVTLYPCNRKYKQRDKKLKRQRHLATFLSMNNLS